MPTIASAQRNVTVKMTGYGLTVATQPVGLVSTKTPVPSLLPEYDKRDEHRGK